MWNPEMAAMGRVRAALQFMLIESRKDVEVDLKPPRIELQYNFGLAKTSISNELSWTTAL